MHRRITPEAVTSPNEPHTLPRDWGSLAQVLTPIMERVDPLSPATQVVVVTSDHGESFGQHNQRIHSFCIYEPAVHVPLVLLHPALKEAPRRVDSIVQHIDIAPTLLDWLGHERPVQFRHPLDNTALKLDTLPGEVITQQVVEFRPRRRETIDQAAQATDYVNYVFSEENAGFLLRALRPEGRLLRTWKAGKAHLKGYLEDYALLVNGLLSLHAATFSHRWLHAAKELTDEMVREGLREVRRVLLEADVNFKVVKQFVAQVKERCVGEGVLTSLDPGQQVVKIVNEELAALMGGSGREIVFASKPPTVILMAGLQGSGKTTACAKLAMLLKGQKKSVALAACDLQRPAAVEQLVKVGTQAGATVYERGSDGDPVETAAWALEQAAGKDVLIVDTAGRLHVDEELMEELVRIRKRVKPHNVLLVVDAMTGQDAVNVAEQFSEVAEFDGVVMTKLDGDARGGAALSIKAVTGKPILYASTGEKIAEFEPFHPDRMASRILGMGDVLSLIERAEQAIDIEEAQKLEEKVRKDEFTLEDFKDQLQAIKKMGPLEQIIGMIPGMGNIKQLAQQKPDDKQIGRIEAIINSMTPHERRRSDVINGSRRKRIARGSGTSVQEVNQLLRQYGDMKKMMKAVTGGGKKEAMRKLAARFGGKMKLPL